MEMSMKCCARRREYHICRVRFEVDLKLALQEQPTALDLYNMNRWDSCISRL